MHIFINILNRHEKKNPELWLLWERITYVPNKLNLFI